MIDFAQPKIPVYGYTVPPNSTSKRERKRKLAAYVTFTQLGYPVLEIKSAGNIIWVDLPVLMEQLSQP